MGKYNGSRKQYLGCNHKWEEIEDYNSRGFLGIFKTRVKIFKCKNCGRQSEMCFSYNTRLEKVTK